MLCDWPTDQDFVSWLQLTGSRRRPFDKADAGCIDEQLVCRAARDDFRISGDDLYAYLPSGFGDTLQNLVECFEWQALFEDQPQADPERSCAGDRQIIGGAIDGQ